MTGGAIIVTRPQPDADRFAALAAAAGLAPVLSPVMEIVFRPASAPPRLDGVGALAFTSANGVRALAATAASCAALPAFAVGPASAEAARNAGFHDIAMAGGDVVSLSALIGRTYDRKRGAILHVCGADRAGDLAGRLEAQGIEARRAVLYEARPAAALTVEAVTALKAGAGVCVALFSPRSARLFIDQARAGALESELSSARALCLSGNVAQAARAAQWARIEIAAEAVAGALLDLATRARS